MTVMMNGVNVTTSVSNKKGLPGTFAQICAWQSGPTFKNIGNVQHVGNVCNVPGRVRRSWRSTSYIYRYFADRQLFFLTVNTFIYWIFNVIFNPVHHHCHLFTDFYKKFTCVEFKPLLIVRKSDTFIFWKACLLVVPAGFNPRIYNIKTLHYNSSGKMYNDRIIVLFSYKKKPVEALLDSGITQNFISKTTQYTIGQKNNTALVWINKTGWKIPNKIWNKTALGR